MTGDSSIPPASRIALSNEWHARPNLSLPPPLRCSHLVSLRSEISIDESRAQFARFCEAHGQPQPAAGSRHHSVEIGTCLIKWEGHTEADSHTVVVKGNAQPPFAETALDFLEVEKRSQLLSSLFVGVHIEVLPADDRSSEQTHEVARALLGGKTIYGGSMAQGLAEVWSSFRLDANGFVRLVIIDRGITEDRLARLMQRLLEMETYRILAMMALPRARQVMGDLGTLEPQLDDVMRNLAATSDNPDQESLLHQITAIAARAEHIASTHAYRFAAARAYTEIVQRRIAEADEQKLDGQQRYSVFLQKSLLPAMRTCDAAERRTHEVAERVARAAGLLNSMVDMVQKKQNQDILESMAQNAERQLRLQQAVEGFSIFAISYYAVGLIGYALKSAKEAGLPVNPDLLTGITAPITIAVVWISVRVIRRRLGGQSR